MPCSRQFEQPKTKDHVQGQAPQHGSAGKRGCGLIVTRNALCRYAPQLGLPEWGGEGVKSEKGLVGVKNFQERKIE